MIGRCDGRTATCNWGQRADVQPKQRVPACVQLDGRVGCLRVIGNFRMERQEASRSVQPAARAAATEPGPQASRNASAAWQARGVDSFLTADRVRDGEDNQQTPEVPHFRTARYAWSGFRP